jgi:hypothetical protein
MKRKIILLLMLFLFIRIASAQVFDKTSSWTEITTNLFDESYRIIRNYKLMGDTIIDERQYTKVHLNNDLYDAALRETEDNKIYAYFYSLKTEKLIYDFLWEVGKKIYFEYYEPIMTSEGEEEGYYKEITQINSVCLLDGNDYNYLPLENDINDNLFIIQGIGDVKGFFHNAFPVKPTNGDQEYLLCFSKNGHLIYKNESFDEYDSETNISVIDLKDNWNIVQIKNTAKGILVNFPIKNEMFSQFYLYDIIGNKIGSYSLFDHKQLEINGLNPGYYFYLAIGKNNKYSGKFIIKK